MECKVTIPEVGVGMNNSTKEEAQKDEGGASPNNASATVQTPKQLDTAEVHAAARLLADVIKGANVENITFEIETLTCQTNSVAIFNFRGLSRGSLLHIAAATGNSHIVSRLLDHVNANLIAAEDDWGNTPLHIAVKAKAFEVAKMLIQRAEDVPISEKILRIKNRRGNTALHEAVLNSHAKMVRYLLEKDLEPMYWMNAGQKSVLYLALDAEDRSIPKILFSHFVESSRIEGLPLLHGAIMRSNDDFVNLIFEKNKKLFDKTDSGGSNVFHLAAYMNQPGVFKFLGPETEHLAQQQDTNGDLPIHIASKMGHVDLVDKLYLDSPFLNRKGQTVLHVAAKYGQASVVKYILRHPEVETHLNAVDHDGNTPLHFAAMHSQPTALIPLLLDQEIQLAILNDKCLTAIEIARDRVARGYTIRKHLASLVLACSCTEKVDLVSGDSLILRPEARDKKFALVRSRKKTSDWEIIKDFINSRMVVATLVATVTFAAGFAVPGGFNGSDSASNRGMAMMLDKRMFQAFAICNTIAMFCSMTAVVNLIWARLNDVDIAVTAYEHTTLPLKIALPAMSIAFLTGVTLTVGKLPWLANTLFCLGFFFILIISSAALLEYPPAIGRHSRPIRRLIYWFILAYIYLWRVETYLYDDAENDEKASGTTEDGKASGTSDSGPTPAAPEPPAIFYSQVRAGEWSGVRPRRPGRRRGDSS